MNTATASLRVNTGLLLSHTRYGDHRFNHIRSLRAAAGLARWNPFLGEDAGDGTADLPAFVAYDDLAPRLHGELLLDVLESLEGVDHSRFGGYLLAALAENAFLPQVPKGHPGRAASVALIAALRGYLQASMDAAAVLGYVGAAFNFRSDYGTTVSAVGSDSIYEQLFDAMPGGGLDCPIGEGRWHLAMHWRPFCRFMATRGDGWRMLDGIEDALDEDELVPGNAAANSEAIMRVKEVILDAYRDIETDQAAEDAAPLLAAVIEAALPAALAATRIAG